MSETDMEQAEAAFLGLLIGFCFGWSLLFVLIFLS